tara:strand:+ start:967 stop:1290 length:324 start_codon:yes stop_codon:yes gene_type:complete
VEIVNADLVSISNRFDDATGQLSITVDAYASGVVQAPFLLESQSPEVIVEGVLDSVTALDTSAADFAMFDEPPSHLFIPALEIGDQIALRNLVLINRCGKPSVHLTI